ncbi:LacI family transcriptional regulator [Levilactobacillus brevis]|uniref:LacI family DNA-binding transcriptional regulator n=1 Tax=Levilactobacillus brevis TaxID=1580 RepID=UPI001C1E9D9C|nr:LacI family DNA-binding transcriptional regulator [Levilactobacillus brevis]MBU7558059.1 LacI family DNA-binding transcriptional regulator [Levilactobacillus brevis]MCE6024165.1 LacI family transcriptional regulator [Levilactobacillus brevis]
MTEVTIRTIAQRANVSHTTVSRALNDSPLVKEETKSKIRQLADELGYVPNLNAKGLVENRSFLIGIFFSELDTGTSPSFLVDVINRAKVALPAGYSLSLDSIESLSKSSGIFRHQYDGAIVVSQSRHDDAFIEMLIKQGLPVVVLNREIDRQDVPNFATNDYLGTEKILEYAIRMGHQTFGIIQGATDFVSAADRQQAFEDVVRTHQVTVKPEWRKRGTYLPDSGYEAMRAILGASTVPTCIFAANDDMAVGAMRACQDLGYSIPGDISIIGYDDMSYAKYLIPRLTTVRKPTDSIVKDGVAALTQLLDDSAEKVTKKIIVPTLIVRDSVKDLRN